MKTLFFCCALIGLLSADGWAQDDQTKQAVLRDRINSSGNMASGVAPGGMILGMKAPAGSLLGDPYADSTFQPGNVVFYEKLQLPDTPPADVLTNTPLRLDLRTYELEFRTISQGIRVAPWSMVRVFSVPGPAPTDTSRFINIREYNPVASGNKVLVGFFEQVAVGRLSLLRYPSVSVRKANYNPALNVGSRDDELEKETVWYVAQGRRVQPFSPGKKTLLSLMGDKAPEIEAWLKVKKPDLKSKDDLKAAFQYYNSL